VVDNYDSFTWNLVHELAALGAEPAVVRHDEVGVAWIERGAFDGIVLSPGPGRPEEAGISLEVVRRLAGRVPLLGVCLGHQVIARACGGRIVGAPSLVHGKTSAIHHDGRALFRGLANPFVATRYHSLVVDPLEPGQALEICARTADGVIMGLRHADAPLWGVQFHPESVLTVEGRPLLANFLRLCGEFGGEGCGLAGEARAGARR
jgi:anthranilate synthase component 2